LNTWTQHVKQARHHACTSVDTGIPSQPLHTSSPIVGGKSKSKQAASGSPLTAYSANWSGYVDLNNTGSPTYSGVIGQWTLPCTSKASTTAHALTWVGLGGWTDGNLWQGGTIDDYNWGQYLWWEAWPQNSIQAVTSIPLTCGDTIYAEADYNHTVSGQSYVYLQDVTSGHFFTQTFNFTPDRLTSEWIDERPGCGNQLTSLANFHQVSWQNGLAASLISSPNTWNMIQNQPYPYAQVSMENANGTIDSHPGALTPPGSDSFIETYVQAGDGTANCPV
jgi:hypothetical protein